MNTENNRERKKELTIQWIGLALAIATLFIGGLLAWQQTKSNVVMNTGRIKDHEKRIRTCEVSGTKVARDVQWIRSYLEKNGNKK